MNMESMWRQEQAPQLTFLCCSKTVRSRNQRLSIKKPFFLNILQYPMETPLLESLFKKVADPNAVVFP